MIMTEDVPWPTGLHLKLPGVGWPSDTAAVARKRDGASSARRSAGRIDAGFAGELVDQRIQEPDIVYVEPVRVVVAHDIASVPIALIGVGIDDGKAFRVGQAVEAVARLDPHLRAAFPRAVHRHHERRALFQPLRQVDAIGPRQRADLDGSPCQRARQLRHFGSRRIEEVDEQRAQPHHDGQGPKGDAQSSSHGECPLSR
jgi:hypothetical protein